MHNTQSQTIVWPRTARVRRSGARHAGPPDPAAAARAEAERINANRHLALTARMEHILADATRLDRAELLSGLAGYHQEAMSRTPSSTRYPEAKPWVEYTLTYERELRRQADLNEWEIAVLMSLDPYLMFRGFKGMALKRQPVIERCRAAFLPETDEGPLLIKNAEGDLVIWQPEPPLPASADRGEFWWERVDWVIEPAACGMHFDDEPEEIFPLPVFTMAAEHAATTPEVVEFLQRYAPFWGAENILIVDRQLRAMAIEKTSRNFFEPYAPDGNGRCYASGMCCRDYATPQGKHVREKRDEYCRLFNLPDDVVDRAFWKLCDDLETMLADGLAALPATPPAREVCALFATPYPTGLCYDNYICHPDQAFGANTVVTYATTPNAGRYYRWQRSLDGKTWPKEAEVCRYK